MCFAFDALPPELPAELALPPIAGGAGAARLELTSADGTRFMAALAQSPEPREPAVVILPDVRGLYPFYVALAERFAQAGHHAIAIDYFGRTAGTGERGEAFDWAPHIAQTQPELIRADMAAAIDALREQTGAEQFAAVGFCFGGSQAFLAATGERLALAGVVGFYGRLTSARPNMPSPKQHASAARCPVLGLFGGADEAIPQEDVEAFARELQAAGVPYELEVYPDAPHSFFDRAYEQHAEACADAWRRTLAFLEKLPATSRT
ncbi:MAG: dienelactone hydrolase family protein [Conexibacter sp.]